MTEDQVQHGGILYSPTHGSWDLPNHQLLIPKAQVLCCESASTATAICLMLALEAQGMARLLSQDKPFAPQSRLLGMQNALSWQLQVGQT